MLKENKSKKLLLLGFTLSGMSSFIYEIVWIRQLQTIFGSTIYAVSTLLTSFMFGFALGSYFFKDIADKSKHPALMFAGLELGIGLYGILIIPLFKLLPSIYLNLLEISGIEFFQFFLAFVVLLIPAVLFGATWPVLSRSYSSLENIGEDVGKLYSFNSLGCAFGSLSAGFLLIPLFGIERTSLLVAFLNILIAIMVFTYFRKNETSE